MFFDIVILNPQHKGNFSHAWIAATRGVRFIPKGQVKELSIPVLCQQLADFIMTNSTDPKKRFSLRLSAILLNGTIKIYKEKVLLLQAEVITALHTIRVPTGMSSVAFHPLEASGILNTPPTPSVRVRKARGGKKQVVATATPISVVAESAPETGVTQITDVADVLRDLPTAGDLIYLREEAPRRVDTLIPEDEDFGVITGAELEKEIQSLFPGTPSFPVVPPVTPETPSSELPPPQVVEVVDLLVHAEKGEFLRPAQIPSAEDAPKISSEIPIPMEVDEIQTIPVKEPEDVHLLHPPGPEVTQAVTAAMDIVTDETVLRELVPAQRKASTSEELRDIPERAKKVEPAAAKLFLSSRRRPFARINRCMEGGGTYVDESCHAPVAVKSFRYDDWFNLYWPEEDEEVREDVRRIGSSSRSISLGLGRTSTSKKSSLEKFSTSAASAIETPLKEPTHVSGVDILPTPEEAIREKEHDLPEVPSVVEELITTRMESGQVSEPLMMASRDPSMVPILPVVLEHQLGEPTGQELPSEIITSVIPEEPSRKKKKPRVSEAAVDYKIRQQKIIDKLIEWNFDEKLPTIEDISEKPMTRLNMARAFSDLLVLCKKKFIILRSIADSIELEFILLGPRLEKL